MSSIKKTQSYLMVKLLMDRLCTVPFDVSQCSSIQYTGMNWREIIGEAGTHVASTT